MNFMRGCSYHLSQFFSNSNKIFEYKFVIVPSGKYHLYIGVIQPCSNETAYSDLCNSISSVIPTDEVGAFTHR